MTRGRGNRRRRGESTLSTPRTTAAAAKSARRAGRSLAGCRVAPAPAGAGPRQRSERPAATERAPRDRQASARPARDPCAARSTRCARRTRTEISIRGRGARGVRDVCARVMRCSQRVWSVTAGASRSSEVTSPPRGGSLRRGRARGLRGSPWADARGEVRNDGDAQSWLRFSRRIDETCPVWY